MSGLQRRGAGGLAIRVALALVHLLIVWGGLGVILWAGDSQLWSGSWELNQVSAELWCNRAVVFVVGSLYLLFVRSVSPWFVGFWAGCSALLGESTCTTRAPAGPRQGREKDQEAGPWSAGLSVSAGGQRPAPHREVELASERHQRLASKGPERRRVDDDALGVGLLGLAAEQAWSDSSAHSSEATAPSMGAGVSSYDSDSSGSSFDGGGGDFGGGGSSGEW